MARTALVLVTLVYIWTIFFNTSKADRLVSLPKFPAILVFGDSTVDTGNNNYFTTIAKADFSPYGENYPGHVPTGRFSNGKLIPDFLAYSLKIKEVVPPFLNPNLSYYELITGVNFASAASGFDDLTNAGYSVIPFSKQIELFKNYTARLNKIVGKEKTRNIINNALVIISAGTNDVFGKNDVKYHYFLLNRLEIFVKELYDMGCRLMIIAGLPPTGCLPSQLISKINTFLDSVCIDEQNAYAQSYNEKLVKLLPQLQAELSGTRIAYADVYEQLMDMVNHPTKYGFVETKRGCCGTGLVEAAILCNPVTITCTNSSQYLFWDAVHPTQSAYIYLSRYIEKELLPKLL